MPRANRHFLPSHIWHITHRCHQRAFLLKFARQGHGYVRSFGRKSGALKPNNTILREENSEGAET